MLCSGFVSVEVVVAVAVVVVVAVAVAVVEVEVEVVVLFAGMGTPVDSTACASGGPGAETGPEPGFHRRASDTIA
jgi:hypothetical protein